jgi:hypothetical protein
VKTISLQSLWRSGINLLGRFERFEGSTAVLRDDLRENIEFSDGFSAKFFGMLNGLADKAAAPPLEDDPADNVDPAALAIISPTHLDHDEAGIKTIIWTTGFNGDYSWIDLEGHAIERGRPIQTNGASPAKGLYFAGSPWVRTRASGILYGVGADGEEISGAIAKTIDKLPLQQTTPDEAVSQTRDKSSGDAIAKRQTPKPNDKRQTLKNYLSIIPMSDLVCKTCCCFALLMLASAYQSTPSLIDRP